MCATPCGKRAVKSRAKNGVEALPCRQLAMARRTFKYRLYPDRPQREKLQATLEVCRELYNAALQERREAWSSHRRGIHYVEQANQLPDIKAVREDVRAVHSQVLQDALNRIDKTFKAFFLRCQRVQVPGFPRFRSASRYDSFTYPQAGFKTEWPSVAFEDWRYQD